MAKCGLRLFLFKSLFVAVGLSSSLICGFYASKHQEYHHRITFINLSNIAIDAQFNRYSKRLNRVFLMWHGIYASILENDTLFYITTEMGCQQKCFKKGD